MMEIVFDQNHYTSAISNRNSRIFEFVPKRKFKDKTMLELGAGIGLPGATFEKLGCTVTSMEGREENAEEGQRRFPDREWMLMNFEDTNLEDALGDKRFDYILCLGLLYHLINPQKLIAEMADYSDVVFFSGIVCDSDDPDLHYNVKEHNEKKGSQDQHLSGSRGSRFSYVWLEDRFKDAGYNAQDITPTEPAGWCTWLHKGLYDNSGEFRKPDKPGHTRKMYMFSK
jgi:protein-L-isoaspartate O-methyltransferase